MKCTLIIFSILLFCCDICKAQMTGLVSVKLSLKNKLEQLIKLRDVTKDENQKKTFEIQIKSIQQTLSKIELQEDKNINRAVPNFGSTDQSQIIEMLKDRYNTSNVEFVESGDYSWYKIQADGKEGVCDANGKEIIPCEFYFITYVQSEKQHYVQIAQYEKFIPYNKYLAIDNNDSEFFESNSTQESNLDRDKSMIHEYIKQGKSGEGLVFLKKSLRDNPPSTSTEEFGYAGLLQDIIIGLGKEGANAAFSMNLNLTMLIQSYTNDANQMQNSLLISSSSKGHKGAAYMLQLKAAMNGGQNYNISNYNNNTNSGSNIVQKKCSLCNGKGWIAGSKSSTYGNTGTYWCSECQRSVNQSHSHDKCPSCSGKGYITGVD